MLPLSKKLFAATTIVTMIVLTSSIAVAEKPMFELLGVASIEGSQSDQSQLTGQLSDGTPANLFGGISGFAYSGEDNSFFALSDRGPKDGAVDWHCRFHRIQINVLGSHDATSNPSLNHSGHAFRVANSKTFNAKIDDTVILKDSNDRHFTGLANVYSENENTFGRFDPEGIRVKENGNVLISDEYGPHLIEFSPAGKVVKKYSVPSSLLVKNPGVDKATENAANESGRACNRGMEGIAVSPDGKFVFGLMQSALIQDSTRDAKGKPVGLHCRIIKMNLETGEQSQFVYAMDNPSFKLHEILLVDENQFYVLENCGGVGEASVCKKVTKISLEGATDVKEIASLPHDKLPAHIVAVKKETVIDLLNPVYGIDKKSMPEKIEGLCFGPAIDGRRTLVIASDNDFDLANPSLFFVFGESVVKP